MSTLPITVLGAGSWGTALAILLSRHGRPALLWGHDPRHMADLSESRCNKRYLPGHPLPESLQLSSSLEDAAAFAAIHLIVVPSHSFRETLAHLAALLQPGNRIAWATKGLEHDSCKLMHEVVADTLGTDYPVAVISGPTFAEEVAAGLPTAVTVASPDMQFAGQLADRLHDDQSFRAYTSNDVIGVELGGAVKNVLAIATGIADGLGLGANTRAALITRGLAEIRRLGTAMGADSETFMGLAGIGDLVLTCTDNQSRNRRMGLGLAAGHSLEAMHQQIGQVVEGVNTAREIIRLAEKHQVEMPICEQVCQVVHEGRDPRQAAAELLARDQKSERA